MAVVFQTRLRRLAGVFAFCSVLNAAEISAIRFEQSGPNPLQTEMLNVTLRLRPGMEFRHEYVDEDIKNLYNTGKVSDVAAEIKNLPGDKVEILYRIKPSPVISVIKLTGQAKFETKELQKQLKISEGERLGSRNLSESIDNLRTFYIGKGYTDATIPPPAIVPDGKGGVIVTIQIKENLRLKVHDVHFPGAKVFPESELRSAVSNQYSYWNYLPFINDYLNRGLLDRGELETDKARLRELYHDKGYLDFKVTGVKLTPTASDPEYVDLEFMLDEGAPYTVDKVDVSGSAAIPLKEVEPLVRLKSGKTFSRADEQATVRNISSLYDTRGYSDIMVRAVRSEDFTTHKVSVSFKIEEGRKYHVRQIVIRGNTATKTKVLLRELAIQDGDPVAKNRIEVSRQRLLGMGYFSKVEADAVNADALDEKDVRFTVEEKPERYNFRIGAGASDVNSVFGMAEVSTDNFDIGNPKNWFYGGGQRLRIQGIYGIENAGFNVDFVEPWLFDLPLRFELSGFMTIAEYDDWTENRVGFRTSLQRKVFDDFTTVAAGYKFEVVRVNEVASALKAYFRENNLDGTFRVSQPSLMIGRDTRDSLVDPTEGYNLNFFSSITPMMLGSSSNYYRLEGKGSYYTNFFDRAIVAMVGAKVGVVSGFDHSEQVPVFERYLMGGSDSIRGFEYRSVGPTVNDKNVGGQTMLLLTAEVSHPIWGPLRGAAFIDAGNAWRNAYSMGFSGLNVGAGYGLRLKLPMIKAPLKLDLAYPIVNNQDDVSSKFRLHFNVGFTF